MIEFNRDSLKTDPVLKRIHDVIKHNHEVAKHTQEVLLKNKHVKDFCEEARHFVILPGKNQIYLHYDTSTWFVNNGFHVRIDMVGVYDSYMEYESARLKGLHSGGKSDIPNIN